MKKQDLPPPVINGYEQIQILPAKSRLSKLQILAAFTGATLFLSLSSCVTPYDSDYGATTSTTSYTAHSPGYRINTLPGGYRSETISGNTYYYQNGNYYRRDTDGYVVTDAPRSSRYYSDYDRNRQVIQTGSRRYDNLDIMTRLPNEHRVINHRGRQYYQVQDRYYAEQNGGYVVVQRPY